MGPFRGDELPDVDGVDKARDHVLRRRVFEDAGWRIWRDSHDNWHGERGDEVAESPMLQFLLEDLETRFLLVLPADPETRSAEVN